jgi:hypothetical protein
VFGNLQKEKERVREKERERERGLKYNLRKKS